MRKAATYQQNRHNDDSQRKCYPPPPKTYRVFYEIWQRF